MAFWQTLISPLTSTLQLLKPVVPTSVVDEPILSAQEIRQLGQELANLPASYIRNPKASESQKQGEQASRYLGSGMEYEESRLYQPGDEVRRINWRLMARTGQPYTKQFQEERQESWTILVDQRQSMRFGTKTRLKVQQATRVAGYYAWQAEVAGLPVEGIRLAEMIETTPSMEGRGTFEQFMSYLSVSCPPLDVVQEPRLYDELLECQRRMQAGSRLILISDFHDLDDATLMLLATLQEKILIKAVLIADAAEKKLPGLPGLKLQSLKGDFELNNLSMDQQQAYQRWSQGYFSELKNKLQQVGIHLLEVETSDDLTQITERNEWLKQT